MAPESFEGRLDRIKESYLEFWPSTVVDVMIKRYRDLVLKIKVGDEKIARLCQAMTDHGCVTFESCEGHSKEMPCIWFFPPKDPKDLMLLSHILQKASHMKNFPWHVVVNGNVNSSHQLSYILEPSFANGPIKLPEDYDKLMQDLDIIAISILNYVPPEDRVEEDDEEDDGEI